MFLFFRNNLNCVLVCVWPCLSLPTTVLPKCRFRSVYKVRVAIIKIRSVSLHEFINVVMSVLRPKVDSRNARVHVRLVGGQDLRSYVRAPDEVVTSTR